MARTAAFVAETGGTILSQLKAIGASADWTRTAYTLSPQLSRAVREAFVRLYERGLIYRGHRVIHWCPRCLTSLSDEEAEHHDVHGRLYHISYPITAANATEEPRFITVATTRPETLLGDVAVAVHPDDPRYQDLIGRTVMLPVANVEIPIIADEYSDPAFGTGAVKITPAHDANDFEVGQSPWPANAGDHDAERGDRRIRRRRRACSRGARRDGPLRRTRRDRAAARARGTAGEGGAASRTRSGAATAATRWWSHASPSSGS